MFLPGATQTNKFLPTSRAALLLVFSPTCPAGTSHPHHLAPPSRNTNHPTLPSLTHPSLPAQSPSAHHTPASPPPLPLLPQNGWGGGTSLELLSRHAIHEARPSLWTFGDAGNLYPLRETFLSTLEWMECMCTREELEYPMPGQSIDGNP